MPAKLALIHGSKCKRSNEGEGESSSERTSHPQIFLGGQTVGKYG